MTLEASLATALPGARRAARRRQRRGATGGAGAAFGRPVIRTRRSPQARYRYRYRCRGGSCGRHGEARLRRRDAVVSVVRDGCTFPGRRRAFRDGRDSAGWRRRPRTAEVLRDRGGAAGPRRCRGMAETQGDGRDTPGRSRRGGAAEAPRDGRDAAEFRGVSDAKRCHESRAVPRDASGATRREGRDGKRTVPRAACWVAPGHRSACSFRRPTTAKSGFARIISPNRYSSPGARRSARSGR